MSNKSTIMVYLSQLRRDIFAIVSIFLVMLMALWGAGAIDLLPGLIASLIGAGATLIYYTSRAARTKAEFLQEDAHVVTDQIKAPAEAEQAVLDALNQPALILYDGHIKARNAAATRLFNLPVAQVDLSVASLRDPTLLDAVSQVLDEGGHAQCEIQPARNLGEYWLGDVTALGENPRQNGILLVMTDQKPIRLAQQARADFLANASHELRTPLTSISGFLETMKGPAKDDLDAWPRFVDIMDEQTRHMRDLIGDLLSLSRIELSGHVLPDTKLDLALAAEETLDALYHVGAARRLDLCIEKPNMPLIIMGDEGEVKQVIRNLIGNAMKYAPDNTRISLILGHSPSMIEAQAQAARSWAGAGRMTLLNPEQQLGPAVWLQVKDAGIGVAPEYLPRLGERFFRVDDSRGGPIDGTGLGLAIVKHIMARHQGGLAVESLYGKGASFAVWFAGHPA